MSQHAHAHQLTAANEQNKRIIWKCDNSNCLWKETIWTECDGFALSDDTDVNRARVNSPIHDNKMIELASIKLWQWSSNDNQKCVQCMLRGKVQLHKLRMNGASKQANQFNSVHIVICVSRMLISIIARRSKIRNGVVAFCIALSEKLSHILIR